MKLVEILSFNPETGKYDHFTVVTNKKAEKIIKEDNCLTEDFYKFAIENITELKDRPKTHTKALVRDLSEYLKY